MTASEAQLPIVVGTDGSPASDRAMTWALEESAHRGVPLRIVHAFDLPPYGVYLTAEGATGGSFRDEAQQLLDQARERAHTAAPEQTVTTQLHLGTPAGALIAESREAGMVVVGARGRGGFSELLTGSVAMQTATHAHCPAVIVPEPQRSPGDADAAGTAVVGVDGSPASMDALRFAFESASARGLGLTAMTVWHIPAMATGHVIPPAPADPTAIAEHARQVLADSLGGWTEKYPDVDVTQSAVEGHAARELARAAQGAELLVVGSRGRGGFQGLLLGSVSRALVHHTPCPLAVVRPRRR